MTKPTDKQAQDAIEGRAPRSSTVEQPHCRRPAVGSNPTGCSIIPLPREIPFGEDPIAAMAFAWFIWNRDHSGPTELKRIAWEAA